MQGKSRVSLNSVKVFAVVAANRSISRAAAQLNVTPGAVSHQVKNLELALGVSLFDRKNNSISLTDIGARFYDESISGIQIVERAIEELDRDVYEISIGAGLSFAVRWLIPALEDFKQQYPHARVRVETWHQSGLSLNHGTDIGIAYRRVIDESEYGSILLRDLSRPVISPRLLQTCGYKVKDDISNIPAITCAPNNWDWLYWEQATGVKEGAIEYVHQFDSDDAAIHAAVAGLGMVLATPLLIREELELGTLVELPLFDPLLTGYYCLLPGRRETRLIEYFKHWVNDSLVGEE